MRYEFLKRGLRQFLLTMGLAGLVASASAAPVITNPSFEVDPTPAYPGIKGDITGWAMNAVSGASGLNTASGPFHTGLIPDGKQVLLLQNIVSVTQSVSGFEAGKQYYFYCFENAREGNAPTAKVTINGGDVIAEHDVTPVGSGNPYHFMQATFPSPGDGAYDLTLANTSVVDDNTVLYDMISIAEVGGAANIQPDATTLDFGASKQNDAEDNNLTIYNNGGSNLTVSGLTLAGADKGAFSVVSPTGSFTVAPGQSKVITVRYSRPSIGTVTDASLNIASNDPDTPTTIALAGITAANAEVVNGNFETDAVPSGVGYASGTNYLTGWTHTTGNYGLNTSAGPFHSGLIPEGTQVLFLQGLSTVKQTVNGFEAGKQYYLSYFENGRDGNTPKGRVTLNGSDIVAEHDVTPVGSGNPYTFKQVTFASPGAGDYELEMMSTLDGDQTVLYDAIRIVEVGSEPNLLPGMTSIDFGTATVGNIVEKSFNVYNNGGSTLSVSDLSLTGTNGADFTVVSPAGAFTVAPGQAQTVTVRYAPADSSTVADTALTITSNDADSPAQITLAGKAVGDVEVANGSFEEGDQSGWPGYNSSAPGWTFSGSNCGFGDYNNAFYDNGTVPDGTRVGFIQGGGWVKQSVPGFVAGKAYKVSLWVNARASTAQPSFKCTIGSIELFNESVTPIEAEGSHTLPFHHYEATFTAPTTGNLDLTITSGEVEGNADRSLAFDNITIGVPRATDQSWNPYQAVKATTAPVIDGVISANEYPGFTINMTESNVNTYGGWMSTGGSSVDNDADLSGRFTMMWDETYLYLAATVADNEVDYLLNQGGALNASDGIQLCLDYNNTGKGANEDDSVTIHDVVPGQKSDSNTAAYWQHWSKTQGNEAGYPKTFPNSQFKSRKVTGGYEIEFAIKWSDCTGFSGATVGKTMGYMTLIMEFEGGANTDLWVNGGNGANVIGSASGWNKMVLVDAAQGPVNAARRGWTLYQ